jgi:hypothetical protein
MAFRERNIEVPDEERKSIFEEVEQELIQKPTYVPPEAPMKALFYGADGTGKSGTALSLLDEIDKEKGEKIVLVDLDAGNFPSILAYHREAYENGNLILFDPTRWKEIEETDEKDVVLDYKTTMMRIKAVGIWVKDNYQKHKIRGVIVDGLSTLLKHAEYQMRIEKNIDVTGGVALKYWINRNKMFLEMIGLYKSIPLDTIYIGHEDFASSPTADGKQATKIMKNTNDMMFQKVHFRTKETPDGKVQFIAKIDKSKQNILNKGREVIFAEVDTTEENNTDYYWEPSKVLSLLRPAR